MIGSLLEGKGHMENEKRILVVDDNTKNIQVIGSLIKKMGFPVNVATSGKQALKILETETPELILCDVMMPEMDGFQLCLRLKHNYKTKDIPVIFLTASNEEEDEARGLEVGAVDFIRKPINPPVLTARVNTHIQLQEALKGLRKQNEILLENARLKEDVERISKHDLKNPLQAVIGVPEVLLDADNITAEQKELLYGLQKSGYDMLEMIDKSLDLYKMEMGMYEVKYSDVDILSVGERVKESLDYLMKPKMQNFMFFLNGEEVDFTKKLIVSGEDLLFFSMISNLLKNAIEASPEGGSITMNIFTNSEFIITLENNGTISEKLRGRFFDKYVTSGKDKGTGLGTYSAKLIVQTLGGKIKLNTDDEDIVRIVIVFPKEMIVT